MPSDRRYTEREMAMILRLATEREAKPLPAARGRPVGRTLAEIEDIASDAGISTAAIRAAAAALEEEEPGFLARFLDAPTTFRYERTVSGALSAGELKDLLSTFQWQFGKEGEEISLGEGVGWRRKTDEGPLTQLEITPRGDHTRVRLLGRWEDPASWVIVAGGAAAAVVSGLGIAFLDPSAVGVAGVIGGSAAASWLGARAWWRRISARVRRRLGATIDGLETEARRLAAARTSTAELPGAGDSAPGAGTAG